MEFILFLIGFAASFLGTLGGGGGMINMPAMMLAGIPIHTIIAVNKFSNTISSFSSFFILLKDRKVEFREAAALLPVAFAGGITGAGLAAMIPPEYLEKMALVFLTFACALLFWKQPKHLENKQKLSPALYPALYGTGIYDGIFGPGQAVMLMQIYLSRSFPYMKAIALTRFQTFASCLGAAILYGLGGLIDWSIAVYLAAGSLSGAQLAVRTANKLSKKQGIWIVRISALCLLCYLYVNAL
ncbi:sulfite exporter TauE/SafE family protein [Metabacillus lacus]|nr:sulfite exporter TauE/SafE family protein [Metabacillus lacus]